MIGIDTSVLVRYFTHDDDSQWPIAHRLLQRELTAEQPGFVSLVVLAETAWVLRSRYRTTQHEIITIIESLLAAPNVAVQDENAVWSALDDCQRLNIGFADALIASLGQHHGCATTLTFDTKAARLLSMSLLR